MLALWSVFWAFAWILSETTPLQWAGIIISLVAAVGVGSVLQGVASIKKLRFENQSSQGSTRTIAAEEAENAVSTIAKAMREIEKQLAVERSWREQHAQLCPMMRNDVRKETSGK